MIALICVIPPAVVPSHNLQYTLVFSSTVTVPWLLIVFHPFSMVAPTWYCSSTPVCVPVIVTVLLVAHPLGTDTLHVSISPGVYSVASDSTVLPTLFVTLVFT